MGLWEKLSGGARRNKKAAAAEAPAESGSESVEASEPAAGGEEPAASAELGAEPADETVEAPVEGEPPQADEDQDLAAEKPTFVPGPDDQPTAAEVELDDDFEMEIEDPDSYVEETVEVPQARQLGSQARFRNTMDLDDDQIEALLRRDHYPHLGQVPADDLYCLARVEEDLMARAEAVGRAWQDALRRVVPSSETWAAAFWFSCLQQHPDIIQALEDFEAEDTPETARALGWRIHLRSAELRAAAPEGEDPASLLLAFDSLQEAIEVREDLVADHGELLLGELDHIPIEARGVFLIHGFRWLR